MEIDLSEKAIDDLIYWKKSGKDNIQKKIEQLLKAIKENPVSGIGKLEPLKYNLSGFWSRRIDKGNRIVYKIGEEIIYVYSLKRHYD